MAYASEELGPSEIYIIPVTGQSTKRKVSTAGGAEPVWPRGGNELFYRQGNQLMAVEIKTQPALSIGKPVRLFEGAYVAGIPGRPNYDVASDRQRFVMIQPAAEEEPARQLNIAINWSDELKRRVK